MGESAAALKVKALKKRRAAVRERARGFKGIRRL